MPISQMPPCVYETDQPTPQKDLHQQFWKRFTDSLVAHCESLSKPATTSEQSSLDVTLFFGRGAAIDFVDALEIAAADARQWLATHEKLT